MPRTKRPTMATLIAAVCAGLTLLDSFATPASGFVLDGKHRRTNGVGADAAVEGCYHNGTVFHDGSLVPTVEPCLQCKCRDRNLVCSLRICTDLPVPPPRGCVLVQKRGICCAYVTCSKFHKLNEIAQRRGDGHTISRRRQPGGGVGGGGVGSGGGYGGNALFRGVEDDAQAHQVEGNEKLCVVNGTIYKSGSAMTSSSLCSYCYCIAGRQKCVQPKCLLASPGCEPIYSDSTCCPIRYDCTKKTAAAAADSSIAHTDDISASAKPSNVVHHSNKHYLRTKMRTQRSRGCIVGAHFFSEGLKLPHDAQHPCNICFCIRGAAKCTPKKCAPSIANCTAIIPPGQCCPASYECDHSGDKVPNKSRQFDFFSMFFGDEFENGTASQNESIVVPEATGPTKMTSRPPPPSATQVNSSSASDSIFAAIEAGLKYIESNDDKVGSLLDGATTNNETTVRNSTALPRPSVPQPVSSTTEKELSFLDILLGEDDEDDIAVADSRKPQAKPSTEEIVTSTEKMQDRISTGDYDETTVIITRYAPDQTSTSRIVDDLSITEDNDLLSTTYHYSDATGDISTITDNSLLESTSMSTQTTDTEYSTTDGVENVSEIGTSTTNDITANSIANEHDSTDSSTAPVTDRINESTVHEKGVPTNIVQTSPDMTVTVFTAIRSTTEPIANLKQNHPPPNRVSNKTSTSVTSSISVKPSVHNVTALKTTTENIFSALFDGISSMFNEHNGTATGLNKLYKIRVNTDRNATHRTPQKGTSRPSATHRLRNATATTTVLHSTKSHPTPIPLTHSSTLAPFNFNSNPSILESDLSYDYGEPTLPPSLPNLKIIPFLPTDAVKTNRNHLNYGYYNNNAPAESPAPSKFDESYSFPGESQPVLSIEQLNPSKESKVSLDNNEFELFHVGAQMSGAHSPHSSDSDEYVRHSYPAITESIYDLNDPSRFDAETQKKLYPAFTKLGSGSKYPFDADLGVQSKKTTVGASPLLAESGGNGYDIVTGYEKFVTAYPEKLLGFGATSTGNSAMFGHDQFSPPSKTEGGFMPKETLEDPYLYDSYHKTKPMIDLTTSSPFYFNRSEGSAPTQYNAYQNTIQSEAPLDTFSLTRQPDDPSESIDHDYSSIVLPDIEDDDDSKNIISITTDSSYRSTSEYAEAPSVDSKPVDHNIDYRHQSLTSLFPSVSTSLPHTSEHRFGSTPRSILLSTSTTAAPSDLFGSLFGFLFKDEEQLAEFQRYDETSTTATTTTTSTSTTIPPFRKITSLVSLNDLLNLTEQQKHTSPASPTKYTSDSIPQRINDKVFESVTGSTTSTEYSTDWSTSSSSTPETTSTTLSTSSTPSTSTDPFYMETSSTASIPDLTDLHILRDALLSSLSNSDPATLPIPSRHPIYQGSVPFLSPIFQARPESLESKHSHHQFSDEHNPIRSDLDLILSALPKAGQSTAVTGAAAGVGAGPEYSSVPSRRQEYVVHNGVLAVDPVVQSTVQTFDGGAAQIFTKPSPSTVGLLKLAGCNIYGRMYRVGRIISELSSECLECRCTEVGVNCTPLDC